MELNTLIAFFSFAFVASATPGPNNVLLTATGASVGVSRGLPVLFGIVSGFAVMIFVLAIGLGKFIVARPDVLEAVRYAGIAFMLWLSWKIASAPVATAETGADRGATTPASGFWSAALFQWVNPKAWLVIASAIASFLQAGEESVRQAMLFAVVFVIAGFLGCLPWLAFGAYIRRWLTAPRASRLFNALMGLILATSLLFIAP